MKIKAVNTLGEISHFVISGYFVISVFDITGVDCIYIYIYIPYTGKVIVFTLLITNFANIEVDERVPWTSL